MSRRRKRRLLGQRAIRRLNLWQVDPCCYWCRKPTLLGSPGGVAAARRATLDHVFSRFHPRRGCRPEAGEAYTVLACVQCNQARCRQENLLFRGFLDALDVWGVHWVRNDAKVSAFRLALAAVSLPSPREFPQGLSPLELAQAYLASDTQSALHRP